MNKNNSLKHIINETIKQTLMESGMFDKTATPVATKTDAQRELGINPLRTDVGNHGGNEEVRQPSTQDWNGANFKGKLIIIPDKRFTFYKVKQFGNPNIKDTSSLFGGTGKGDVELKKAIDTVNGAATRNNKSVTYRFITSETNNETYKISQNPGRTIGTFCEFSYDGNQWFIMKPQPVQNLKISSFKEPISENKQYKTDTNMKQTIKLNKETLKKMIAESVKNILSEDLNENESFDLEYDDNGYITNLPEDIEEWGRKCQQLGYELSLLKGKYRFINDELYDMLDTIDQQLNGANADLNTFSIAKHWSL